MKNLIIHQRKKVLNIALACMLGCSIGANLLAEDPIIKQTTQTPIHRPNFNKKKVAGAVLLIAGCMSVVAYADPLKGNRNHEDSTQIQMQALHHAIHALEAKQNKKAHEFQENQEKNEACNARRIEILQENMNAILNALKGLESKQKHHLTYLDNRIDLLDKEYESAISQFNIVSQVVQESLEQLKDMVAEERDAMHITKPVPEGMYN